MLKIFIFSLIILFLVPTAYIMAGSNPIVYYTFDEMNGQAVPDASGNGNDGKVIGQVKLSNDGKIGKSFEFDGQRSYVEFKRVVQDDFTLMCWIKTDKPGLAGNQAYLGTGIIWSDVGGVANDFIMALLEKKLSFFVGNPDQSVISDTDVVTGDWVHIVSTRNAKTGEIALFINGKMDKSLIHGNKGSLTALPTIAVGGNVLDNRFYTGLIDDVKIFDSVLSEQDIRGTMNPLSVDPISKLATMWGMVKFAQ